MECKGCGAEVAQGLKFCTSCGTPVTITCPSCEQPADPAARFCGHCGSALAAEPSPAASATGTPAVTAAAAAASNTPASAGGLQRERKVATILFADLVGFTALGESQDPEVVQALVTRAFDRLAAEVERYGGLIEKFAGDAMLAVFGVPVVHEDDPERAVRAALEMQRAIGLLAEELRAEGHPPLRLRIGVEAGEVLVDQARAAGERDRMVTGDPVNTSARLQQAADPGDVVVGPSAYAATRQLVRYEELPPLDLKGKDRRVPAWRAVEVTARRDRRDAARSTAFVGRDHELALLQETVRRTQAEGRPHLITVQGPAGMGKSRLVWELEKYVDGLPEAWHWRVGRALAYGQPTFGPIADIMRADVADDGADATPDRLRARSHDIDATPDQVDAVAALLRLDPSATGDLAHLVTQWQGWLGQVSGLAPLIVVFEDLHWADDATLDFVESLARWGQGPLTIIVLARHDLMDRRPSWGGGIPNATTLVLEPLDQGACQGLAAELLDADVPDTLRDRLVAVAEGNPMFLEELVANLADQGVLQRVGGPLALVDSDRDVDVPTSVQAVVAARLDALSPTDKAALQAAAVVGRTFWVEAVADLTGASLADTADAMRRLRAKQLVVPAASSIPGMEALTFRHTLLRDAAYEALPMSDRARRHAQVVRWARRRLGEPSDDVIEVLATHVVDALRLSRRVSGADTPDAEQLRTEVVALGARAGARARSLGQWATAADWFEAATEAARDAGLPPRRRVELELDFLEAASLCREAPLVLERTEELVDLTQPLGDPELLARVRRRQVYLLARLGHADRARAVVDAAIEEVPGTEPSPGRAELRRLKGGVLWRFGPAEEAEAVLHAALAEARSSGAGLAERWALHELGVLALQRGDHGAAVEPLATSMRLADEAGDAELLARCRVNVPLGLLQSGRVDAAREMMTDGLDRARRATDLHGVVFLASNLGEMALAAGDLDGADELFAESLAAGQALGSPQDEAMVAVYLAATAIYRHDHDPAIAWLDLAEAASHETQVSGFQTLFRALVAWDSDPAGSLALVPVQPGGRPSTHDAETDLAVDVSWLRMALRLRHHDPAAVAAITERGSRWAGVSQETLNRWRAALTRLVGADDPSPDGVEELSSLAAELVGGSQALFAPEALADAALVAARLDHPAAADLTERALAAFEAAGRPPMLDPVPERRWLP